MKEKLRLWLVPALILALACLLRFALPGAKELHWDEAGNVALSDGRGASGGWYRYDPENYHGPSYILFVRWSLEVFGRTVLGVRFPAMLMGLACVAMAFPFARFFGRRAANWGALFLAVSPAMVYWSRHSIHETTFQFSLMLATWGFLALREGFSISGARALAWGFAGVLLTKECWVIHAFAGVLALGACAALNRLSPPAPEPVRPAFPWKSIVPHFLWPMLTVLLVYSEGFARPDAISGLWKCYSGWIGQGVAKSSCAAHPWWWWFRLLGAHDWFLLAGLAGTAVVLLRGTPRAARWLAVAGIGTLCGYAILPYKTPWCAMSFMWPFAFFIPLAFPVIWRPVSRFIRPDLALAVCAAASAAVAVDVSIRRPAGADRIYADVQSVTMRKISAPVMAWKAANPGIQGRIVGVARLSLFPLCFYTPGADFRYEGRFSDVARKEIEKGDTILVLVEPKDESQADALLLHRGFVKVQEILYPRNPELPDFYASEVICYYHPHLLLGEKLSNELNRRSVPAGERERAQPAD